MKVLIATLLLCVTSLPGEWILDFNTAKSEAVTEKKMILLNFSGSDWCGPCIKLKKEVFESAEFKEYAADHLVLVRADFPRQKKNQLSKEQTTRNETLAEQYNPKGIFPLTVLIDPNGKVVKEWEGFQTSIPAFIADIAQFSGGN